VGVGQEPYSRPHRLLWRVERGSAAADYGCLGDKRGNPKCGWSPKQPIFMAPGAIRTEKSSKAAWVDPAIRLLITLGITGKADAARSY
jgi:hypothetical protein